MELQTEPRTRVALKSSEKINAINLELAEQMKSIREGMGISQGKLAAKLNEALDCNMTGIQISQYENGRVTIPGWYMKTILYLIDQHLNS